MSKSNGSHGHAVTRPLPVKTTTFRIGDEDVEVPRIGFLEIDENDALREHLDALSPEMPSRDYVKHVLHIVAIQTGSPYDGLVRGLLLGQQAAIIGSMNELLRISGFQLPEAGATTTPTPEPNPGTGTSTASALA